MALSTHRYLITYDIEHDRTRTRVSDILEGVGMRVQKSVFECQLKSDAFDALTDQLGRLVADVNGSDLRFYRLCNDCFKASFGLGEIEEGTGREPWLIV